MGVTHSLEHLVKLYYKIKLYIKMRYAGLETEIDMADFKLNTPVKELYYEDLTLLEGIAQDEIKMYREAYHAGWLYLDLYVELVTMVFYMMDRITEVVKESLD